MASTHPPRWARVPPWIAWKRPGLPATWVRVLDRHPDGVEALPGYVWVATEGKALHVAEGLLEMRQGEELPVHTTFQLAGTIALARASGRLASLELSGPIESAGSAERRDGKVEVTGNGKLAWTVRVEPLAPR